MSSLLLFVEEVIVAVHGYQPPLALATQSAPHTETPLAASIMWVQISAQEAITTVI